MENVEIIAPQQQQLPKTLPPRRRPYPVQVPAEDYELVWPALPQTNELIKFSTFDSYVAKVWHVQTFCFEYKDAFPDKVEIFKNLKTGLSWALADLNLFATYMVADLEDPRRFNAQHDSDYAVALKLRDYSNHAQSSALFRQMRARQFPIVRMEDFPCLMPEGLPRMPCIGSPAMAGQVNFFREGVVLTLVVNHTGIDLVALEALVTSWANHTARAEQGTSQLNGLWSSPEAKDRSRMSQGDNHATIDELPGYFLHDLRKTPQPTQNEPNSSLFCRVSKHKLEKMKRNAMVGPGARTSTVDALAGFAWRKVVRARTFASGKPASGTSKLGTGIDLRSRLRNPPARNYLGAAVGVAQIEVDRATLCGMDAAAKTHTATAIRKGISTWDPTTTDRIIGILNTQPKHELVLPCPREVFFTSHEACTMNKQTWGSSLGLPKAVREPYYGRPPPKSEVVLHPRLLNGDAEFTLTLEVSAMRMLLGDPEFREYVQILDEVNELSAEKPIRARL